MSEPRETTKIRIETLKDIAEKLCIGCARKWEFTSDDYRTHIPPSPAEKEFYSCTTPLSIRSCILFLEKSIAPLWYILYSEYEAHITISSADGISLDEIPRPARSIGGKSIHIYIQAENASAALKCAEKVKEKFILDEEVRKIS